MTIPHHQQNSPDGEQWPPAIYDERWVRGAPEFPEGPRPTDQPVTCSQTDNASRTVTFDLTADDDTYFVLTEALREFASRQRWEAEDDPTGTAQSRIQWAECADNALDLIEKAMSQPPDPALADPAPSLAASRAAKRAELGRLRQEREAWEETARACVCPLALCSRRDFRDHARETDPSGCMVCADLDPNQPCYAAVVRGLRAREEAGR